MDLPYTFMSCLKDLGETVKSGASVLPSLALGQVWGPVMQTRISIRPSLDVVSLGSIVV